MRVSIAALLVVVSSLLAMHGGGVNAAGTPIWDRPVAPVAPPPAPAKMTLEAATEIFNTFAARKDISWGYKPDGCYARTHLMHKSLRERGIKSGTIWAFSNRPDTFSPMPNLPDNLVVRFKDGESVSWWYNNAVVIMVEDKYGETPYVIDPAICDRPVLIGEWLGRHMGGGHQVPYLCFTALGVAPILPNGVATAGTGYHPGGDPPGDLDAFSIEKMKECLSKIAR
jgi:hypothetical protein